MLSDPNFLRDFLGGIPGVDVDDEEIQKALRDLVEVRLLCVFMLMKVVHLAT